MKIALSRARSSLSCLLTTSTEGRSVHTAKNLLVVNKQLHLAMKLTGFLIFTACLHVTANGVGQNVTLSVKNASLEKVFTEIILQSGTSIIYNDVPLKEAKPVTLEVKNATAEQVLDLCLKGQPYSYSWKDGYIFVRSTATGGLNPRLSSEGFNPQANPPITGTIRDAEGNPIAGVNIVIKGTKKGVVSDAYGNFNIDANVDDVLIISSVNYQGREIKISSSGSPLIVALEKNVSQLDEVQYIAYGQTSKRYSTGNVSTVKAEDIAKQPVNNPMLAVQGRVPGIVILETSGFPGTTVNVQIQGKSSIRINAEPFYVVDGVPFNSNMGDGITSVLNGTGSPFSYLNPSEIESIEILKDADATSIYGSRASAGAVLITTKKGKAGRMQLNLNLQQGWQKLPRKIEMLNTKQYLELRREAIKNDNLTISPTDYDINGTWDTSRNNDWQEELLGRTAQFSNMQASVSGGTNQLSFMLGVGYIRQTTVLPGDFSDNKGSVNFNLQHTSINKKFNLQFSGNFLNGLNKLPGSDPTAFALSLAPNAPRIFNADGSLNWEPLPDGTATFFNSANSLVENYRNKTTNLISSLSLNYEISKGLKLKSSFGYNNMATKERRLIPNGYFDPNDMFKIRSAFYLDKTVSGFIVEPQIEYNNSFALGTFNLLLGSSYQERNTELLSMLGQGFNTDIEMENIRAASSLTIDQTIQNKYRYNALFGRLNYEFDRRYILNLVARRDGSSRFGRESQFQNFYSVGGAWILTEESFMSNFRHILNFGKIRASYGTTGSDQIGDYTFLSLFAPVSGINIPYQGVVGIAATSHANPFLQWEFTRKFNVAVELSFLSDRIFLEVNRYINKSSNQLLITPLPIQTGFSNIQANLPATVGNRGWEFVLRATPLRFDHFSWETNINFTAPKNKLISFPDIVKTNYNTLLAVGEPITMSLVYKYSGVNAQTGRYEFIDAKGQKVATPSSLTDRFTIINTAPTFYGGWENTFKYKGFELSIFMQYNKQMGQDLLWRFSSFLPGYFNANAPASVLNRWKAIGDIGVQQQRTNSNFSVYSSLSAAQNSDAAYVDVSFLSMKNVSLSYTFNNQLLTRIKLNGLNLFLQGQNVAMFTKFKGWNPQAPSAPGVMPPLRTITVGARINL